MTCRRERGAAWYVFGYGSLLHPDSLRRTLPAVDLAGCIPVAEEGLDALRARERRYAPRPIAVEPYPPWPVPGAPVLAFLGREEFTQPDDVARGLLSAAYRDVVVTGAHRWDQQVPGFAADFHASTDLPGADRVRVLHRQDRSTAREA